MNEQDAVGVIATVFARPGEEDRLEAVLRPLVAATREERGCRRYELFRQRDGQRFVFVEEWESDVALDAHLGGPRIADVVQQMSPFVAGPPEILRFQKVG